VSGLELVGRRVVEALRRRKSGGKVDHRTWIQRHKYAILSPKIQNILTYPPMPLFKQDDQAGSTLLTRSGRMIVGWQGS
jgi:hypothetical protein